MNEATMLLKKQLPSVKKLLRRKTIEREVIINMDANVTTQVFISQSEAPSSLSFTTRNFIFSPNASLVTINFVEIVSVAEYCDLFVLLCILVDLFEISFSCLLFYSVKCFRLKWFS